ncbi:carnitine acyl carnitine carrier [Ceraceosorus bombacis]|uniref:Carnitine acyl carnitine carrier n=2 Tax=Ceraceosorus TaxID=401624 RepID=A0A0N7L9U8_9BASI|nr:mitochondrial carrier [Ceraceosorus guamensis]PWN39635.1 mitochondrial carrier [Ceraceosorus guamensis]CEH14786.1 carnitine acyl carnitine carrier [Ceraceosorus bombacis]
MAEDQTAAAIKDEQLAEKKGASSAIKSFLSGGFGGVSAVLVGHPFDLTKTRLQTAAEGTYTGGLDVVRKTIKADGVKGMYRGMGPPLVGVTPIFAISFFSYDLGKKIVYGLTPDRKDPKLGLGELAFAGFFSAVPTTLVAGPAERVKVLLQLQGQSGSSGPTYNGPVDVVRQLYKEGGLKSVFRGTAATLARDGPGSAAYFCAYETIKAGLTPKGQDPSQLNLLNVLTAGGLAGMSMWLVAIPPDVVKSRYQGAPHGTYNSFIDCARQTIAKDGVKALFKGAGPAMLRAFPANAATFLGVEVSLKAMNNLF